MIDSCSAFFGLGHAFVALVAPRPTMIGRVTVSDPAGTPIASFEGASQGVPPAGGRHRIFSGPKVQMMFMSADPLDPAILGDAVIRDLTVAVEQNSEMVTFTLQPGLLSLDRIRDLPQPILGALLDSPRAGELAQAVVSHPVGEMAGAQAHIDYAHRANGSVFLTGWMPNFSERRTFFLSGGGAVALDGRQAIVQQRPDVSKHLAESGSASLSHGHGFCIAVPTPAQDQSVTVVALEGGQAITVFSGVPQAQPDASRIFQIMVNAWENSTGGTLAKINALAAPFLGAQGGRAGYDIVRRARSRGSLGPKLSVVVPFYREWRFLFSILTMARRAPADWEWVIVCDDETIFSLLNTMIATQDTAVRAKLTLVKTQSNVGYGHANTIGVREAAGEQVLLMNSDIWITDFRPVLAAMEAVGRGDWGLVGFTLLFEDDTIQHAGMSFERAAQFDDLYLTLHPMKGLPLPAGEDDGAIVPAAAVTGALMLMTKAMYQESGGFSDTYIGGDFEDSDLCLRLRAEGRRIGLMRSRGIFHLERQSIRHDGANNMGFIRTLVNCSRFNERWAEKLDAGIFGENRPDGEGPGLDAPGLGTVERKRSRTRRA